MAKKSFKEEDQATVSRTPLSGDRYQPAPPPTPAPGPDRGHVAAGPNRWAGLLEQKKKEGLVLPDRVDWSEQGRVLTNVRMCFLEGVTKRQTSKRKVIRSAFEERTNTGGVFRTEADSVLQREEEIFLRAVSGGKPMYAPKGTFRNCDLIMVSCLRVTSVQESGLGPYMWDYDEHHEAKIAMLSHADGRSPQEGLLFGLATIGNEGLGMRSALSNLLINEPGACKYKVLEAWAWFLKDYVQKRTTSKKSSESTEDTDPAKNALVDFRDQYVGVKEAAEILDVSTSRVRTLASEGRIGTQLLNKTWLFTLDELGAFKRNPAGRPKSG